MAKTTKSDSQARREQRRLEHQDLSRAQLLDAAEEVFGRKGFHETTLKEVADLAGFSVGSVYSFFESKDDLFRQIFLRRGEQFMAGMQQLLADESATATEQLRSLARFQVDFFRSNPHFGRMFLRYSSVASLAAQNDQVDPAVTERYESAMSMQSELFTRGQKSGELCDGDPLVLSLLFSGLISSFQAVDPAVISDDTDAGAVPLDDFLALVTRAFSA
jgi:TetR/AcrR family transcriptional regulator